LTGPECPLIGNTFCLTRSKEDVTAGDILQSAAVSFQFLENEVLFSRREENETAVYVGRCLLESPGSTDMKEGGQKQGLCNKNSLSEATVLCLHLAGDISNCRNVRGIFHPIHFY
jgi:hypothetical protein